MSHSTPTSEPQEQAAGQAPDSQPRSSAKADSGRDPGSAAIDTIPKSGSSKALAGALARFRVMAFITGVLLAVMTVIGLPYAYLMVGEGQDPAAWYSIGWTAHGWIYIAYVAATLDLIFRLRWHVGRALLICLAGTIPFASFFAERYVVHRVQPVIDLRSAKG